MDKQQKSLNALYELLEKVEVDAKRAKVMISNILQWNHEDIEHEGENVEEIASKLMNYEEWEDVKVIEGVYDGYFMVWSDDKKYPVPMNYSSKTKLVPGDVMKLRIMKDGKLVYKLIGPAPRNYIKATLSKTDENKYIAISDEGYTYELNQAAVTFFQGEPWDELSIIINPESSINFAAIEAVIGK